MSLIISNWGHKFREELMEKALEQLSDYVSLVPWGRAQAKQNCRKSELFSITLVLTALVGCSETSGCIS